MELSQLYLCLSFQHGTAMNLIKKEKKMLSTFFLPINPTVY